jgi:calnexin
MPDDWLVDEPMNVPDPEAEKPEDWDDEEDGDWVPPSIPNAKCGEISGCGPWTKPMIKNPDFKGKWTPELIDNPAYKGPWAPRKIKNPNYFEDKTPANLEPMGAIGFEIWTMQSDIMFDNIYIGNSVADAEKFAEETWKVKHAIEKQLLDADKPIDEPKPAIPSGKFTDDPVGYAKEKLNLFIGMVKEDPVGAVKAVPEVAGGLVALAVTVIALIASLTSGASSPAVKKAAADAKDSAKGAKDKVAEGATTGADMSKSEVTKRATRSQQS